MHLTFSNRIQGAGMGKRSQSGVGLIEVMISVLILGVGLLGVAAMQATALRNSQSSLERSQAVALSYAILDAMRANRDTALAGGYNLAAMQCVVPAAGTLAQTDLNRWITALKDNMGQPADTSTCGQVSCAAGMCTVTIQWDDSRGVSTNAAAGDAANREGGLQRQVTTVARL